MRLQPKTPDEDLELDMSPMIDMVFLLLIFFIVASQVIDEKPDVSIPSAHYSKVPENTKDRLMVTVTADERYFVRSAEMENLEMLQAVLKVEFDQDPNLRILIRSDGDTKYKINQKVMEVCGEVGAVDLIYAAFEE